MTNRFLSDLLTLQQDGSGAISGPATWVTKPPILKVETASVSSARALATKVAREDVQMWHFLVGGPGNGKSLAVREFTLALLDLGFAVSDSGGTALKDLPVGVVPAILEVRASDGKLKARIAQDASVVVDPFSSDPNPARELLSTLRASEHDGSCLIACTNRGVLEKAATLPDSDDGSVSAQALRLLVSVGTSSRSRLSTRITNEAAQCSVELSAEPIDVGSLFEPLAEASPFELLLLQATGEEKWASCSSCEVSANCPFKLNRDSLLGDKVRANVLRLLEDAELLDAQPLVFREASALVSLFLAGCAADYDASGPCGWVRSNAEQARWFSLESRRLHMILFSSTSPLGIDSDPDSQQRKLLETLIVRAKLDPERVLGAPPSTQVGISRLLGPEGVLRWLDPVRSVLDRRIASAGWELGYIEDGYVSGLESNCNKDWLALDLAFQEEWPEAGECMAALARWRSAHGVKAAGVSLGIHPWRSELDAFREAVGIPSPPTLKAKAALKKMVAAVLDSSDGMIRIGNYVSLKSEDLAAIEVDWSASKASRTICISLKDQSNLGIAKLGAAAFAWLHRRYSSPLHSKTFPAFWLDTAREAISRAAAASCYSKMPEGQVQVRLPDGSAIELMWDSTQLEGQRVGIGDGA